MISISNYDLKFNEDENVYYVISLEQEAICPICRKLLRPKGRRKRWLILTDGTKIRLKVQRYVCKGCKTSHRELPDIIVPYRLHCIGTFEEIINEAKNADVNCEDSTINRILTWWEAIQLYIQSVYESIKEKYGMDLTAEKKLGKIVRALVNTHSWPSTRSALTPGWI